MDPEVKRKELKEKTVVAHMKWDLARAAMKAARGTPGEAAATEAVELNHREMQISENAYLDLVYGKI
jgi:hypothetical protein